VFKEHLERLSELTLVLLLGGMLGKGDWNWHTWGTALFLFVVARPLSVSSSACSGRTVPGAFAGMIGWFGVRGIGSVYYLMYAINHGLPRSTGARLIEIVVVVIMLSILVHGFSVKPADGQYPRHQAVSLTALPQDSTLWRCINGTGDFARGYQLHLLNDWRDCHQIPLPATFEHFMSQFSSKRRYNLKRQQRQLRDHGQGRLDFHCIEHPGQLDMLRTALAALTTPAHRSELWTEADLLGFARRGMLLCYQLDCGGQACALMLGLRSGGTLYLFNILHDSALDHLSVGTTMLHLAIEDLCDRRHFSMIDLGYGTPGHGYQSTNVTVQRAHLLLMRRNLRNRLASQLHHGFASAIDWLKKNKKK
jgi:hypothetical protein